MGCALGPRSPIRTAHSARATKLARGGVSSADGKRSSARHADCKVEVRDFRGAGAHRWLGTPDFQQLTALSFSPDGLSLAIGDRLVVRCGTSRRRLFTTPHSHLPPPSRRARSDPRGGGWSRSRNDCLARLFSDPAPTRCNALYAPVENSWESFGCRSRRSGAFAPRFLYKAEWS